MYKVISIGNTKYYVNDKSDLVALAQKLVREGYSVSQIARLFGVTEKTVIKYLQDCW